MKVLCGVVFDEVAGVLEQDCLLDGKSYAPPLPLSLSLFFLDYAVASWAWGWIFIEVGLLDGSYLDVIFLHPVYDVV